MDSFKATSYSSGDGGVYANSANVDGISDSAKYKVTAYSDSVLIGTWHADSYSTGDDKISLKVHGISNALIISGDYVVEQFR